MYQYNRRNQDQDDDRRQGNRTGDYRNERNAYENEPYYSRYNRQEFFDENSSPRFYEEENRWDTQNNFERDRQDGNNWNRGYRPQREPGYHREEIYDKADRNARRREERNGYENEYDRNNATSLNYNNYNTYNENPYGNNQRESSGRYSYNYGDRSPSNRNTNAYNDVYDDYNELGYGRRDEANDRYNSNFRNDYDTYDRGSKEFSGSSRSRYGGIGEFAW